MTFCLKFILVNCLNYFIYTHVWLCDFEFQILPTNNLKKKTKKSRIIIIPTISTSFDKYNSPKPGNPTELHNNWHETIDFAMWLRNLKSHKFPNLPCTLSKLFNEPTLLCQKYLFHKVLSIIWNIPFSKSKVKPLD